MPPRGTKVLNEEPVKQMLEVAWEIDPEYMLWLFPEWRGGSGMRKTRTVTLSESLTRLLKQVCHRNTVIS